MADSVQVQWNVVWVIYGSRDAAILMKDQETICVFHWTHSMEKHTKADIQADHQDQR
jgi:hypothetical protein